MSTPRHDNREIPNWGLNLVLISRLYEPVADAQRAWPITSRTEG